MFRGIQFSLLMSIFRQKKNICFFVEKTESGEKTVSDVRVLNEEESIREIARIISGSTITDSAITFAATS